MVGTVAALVLAAGAAILWMTRELDSQARAHSVQGVARAFEAVLDGVAGTALDYSKWDEAAGAAERRDLGWIFANMGQSAHTGVSTSLVVLWGGALPVDLGWTDDGVAAPRAGLLDREARAALDARLAAVPAGAYEAPAYFVRRGGAIWAVAASRVERVLEPPPPALDGAEAARLAMGRRLPDATLSEIESSLRLTGLRLLAQAPADGISLPLLGPDGRPVAHVAWDAPAPGAALLARMVPLLGAVVLVAMITVAVGGVLARRSAEDLVRAERQATGAARTDAPTGLPNRLAFTEALLRPARAGERAVVFLDVRGFKRINDSIGHAAGDRVLVRIARRLQALERPGRLVARLGGDEFALVATGPGAGPGAPALAAEVLSAFDKPVEVMGHRLRVRASIGYAVQDRDGTGEDLVRQADLAQGQSKRGGDAAGPVAFSAFLDDASRDARAIEGALRAALQRQGEISVAYQPIVEVGTGRLLRAEALARWTSAELGAVTPDRFIPVAEQAGLIAPLGRHLLHLVCDDLQRHPDLKVSLNASPLQLAAPDFVPDLIATLAARGLDPSRIEIELTERIIVEEPRQVAQRLRELHEAGFSTALDDFGTGYSSLGYLKDLEFDTVKVDRSYVTGFCAGGDRMALVNAMILLAHALRLRVVCEGIETAEELAMLHDMGCNMAQGYHLDRPLPIARLAERWLGRGSVRAVA